MRKKLNLFLFIAFLIIPSMCFSWGESKHPIIELLIQRIYLDSNYVFCGCDASWGTNVFGLFVYDRNKNTWTNYSALQVPQENFRVSKVKKIQREGDFIYVTFRAGLILRFHREDGSYEIISKNETPKLLASHLSIEGVNYRINRDSVIAGDPPDIKVYTPLPEEIPDPMEVQPEPEVKIPIFSNPIIINGKIYMSYDLVVYQTAAYTQGISVFDIKKETFNFHPSEIFKGTVTGGFIYDTLIIFPTARFVYEGNAGPAAGFVSFDPANQNFSLWKELPLPEEPLALFQVEQDEKEFWIGTDKGVFRIDKNTYKTTHYQITKGIIRKDGTNICPTSDFRGPYPIVLDELNKDEQVELLGVLNGWCEIKPPKRYIGFIEAQYVEEVIFDENTGRRLPKFRPLERFETIPVKSYAAPDAPALINLDSNSLKEYELEIAGESGRAGRTEGKRKEVTWYQIKLPTALVSMDDLIFHLDEVE